MKQSSGENSPRYRALLQLLRTADSIWEASRLFFARWDLSPSQFNVLNLLHLNPQGLSQTELSRHLIVHRSNLTGLVDRLERRGLVQRKDVAADRRAYSVVLSPAGERLLSEILPLYYEGAEEVWSEVSKPKTVKLTMDLERVADKAAAIAKQFTQKT